MAKKYVPRVSDPVILPAPQKFGMDAGRFNTIVKIAAVFIAVLIAFDAVWITSSVVPNFGESLRNVAAIFSDHPFPVFEDTFDNPALSAAGYVGNVLGWSFTFPFYFIEAFSSAEMVERTSIFDGGYYDNTAGADWPVVTLDPA